MDAEVPMDLIRNAVHLCVDMQRIFGPRQNVGEPWRSCPIFGGIRTR